MEVIYRLIPLIFLQLPLHCPHLLRQIQPEVEALFLMMEGPLLLPGEVCWSRTSNPTSDLPTKTTNGTGTGTFISSITGLTDGAVYFVRAYATNIVGTSYGEEISFKTYNFDAINDIEGN